MSIIKCMLVLIFLIIVNLNAVVAAPPPCFTPATNTFPKCQYSCNAQDFEVLEVFLSGSSSDYNVPISCTLGTANAYLWAKVLKKNDRYNLWILFEFWRKSGTLQQFVSCNATCFGDMTAPTYPNGIHYIRISPLISVPCGDAIILKNFTLTYGSSQNKCQGNCNTITPVCLDNQNGCPHGKCFSISEITAITTPPNSISGFKWNDQNNNSQKDIGEPFLPGWEIRLYSSGVLIDTKITDSTGNYTFTNLIPGTYEVYETLQTDWHQTYPPSPGYYIVILSAGERSYNKNFGNSEKQPSINLTKIGTLSDPLSDPCIIAVDYVITVTNDGNFDLYDVFVNDSLLGNFTIGNLLEGQSVILNLRYILTQVDIFEPDQSIDNTANAYGAYNGIQVSDSASFSFSPINLDEYEEILKSRSNEFSKYGLSLINKQPNAEDLELFESYLRCEARLDGYFLNILDDRWSTFTSSEKVKYLASYEDLLRRYSLNLVLFDTLLIDWRDTLSEKDRLFLASFEDLMKRQVKLCKGFEKLAKDLQLNDNEEYIVGTTSKIGSEWRIEFLASFENLLRLKDNPLSNFDELFKEIDWSGEV